MTYETIVLLIMILVSLGCAFYPFKKNSTSLRKGEKAKKDKANPLYDLNSRIKNLEKQIDALHRSLGDRIAKVEIKLNQMEGKFNELRKEIEAAMHPLPAVQVAQEMKHSPESLKVDEPQDARIWVEKTIEGAKKLKPSDTKQDLYMLQEGDIYLLHIPLDPGNYHDLLTLYNDIIDFPFQAGRINEMTMKSYPRYRKQDDCFVFIKKGEITVR